MSWADQLALNGFAAIRGLDFGRGQDPAVDADLVNEAREVAVSRRSDLETRVGGRKPQAGGAPVDPVHEEPGLRAARGEGHDDVVPGVVAHGALDDERLARGENGRKGLR